MTPYRQIRATYDEDTIRVYQAYNDAIASAAVADESASSASLRCTFAWSRAHFDVFTRHSAVW